MVVSDHTKARTSWVGGLHPMLKRHIVPTVPGICFGVARDHFGSFLARNYVLGVWARRDPHLIARHIVRLTAFARPTSFHLLARSFPTPGQTPAPLLYLRLDPPPCHDR